MKIAILSDSHNSWNALRSAVATASDESWDVIMFAGDLTRPKGVDILADFIGPVHMICGNMARNIDGIWAKTEKTDNVIFHGEVCDMERNGVRIYMQHRPKAVEIRAKDSTYDVCIHGHLHEFRYETVGDTRLINPGALTRRSSQPTWMGFDTETDNFQQFYP